MNSPLKKKYQKRITMKLISPNPLFEEWLTEWRDKSIEIDSKMQYCFNKALESLRKYPLPLRTGRDCKILQGFGDKLCMMLDTKLKKYKEEHPLQENTGTSNDTLSKKNRNSINNNKKEYVPALRSGAYAILITLYETSLKPRYPGYMFKNDIIKNGQHLCDKSFVKPDPGSYYTAWSSMKTLLEKQLVTKRKSPAEFSLTNEGVLLAQRLFANNLKENIRTENELINKNETASSSTEPFFEIQRIISDIDSNSSTSLPSITKRNPKKAKLCTASSSSLSSNAEELAEVSNQSESESVYSSNTSQEETFIFAPNSFDVILYVDKQEVSGCNQDPLDEVILAGLTNLNVRYEVKHLKVGDYTWVCRQHSSNKELVLPYIIERKRMDDFGSSIKDGRFHEQKFRLKQCGIENLIYLVESYGNNTYTGLPMTTLYQAAANTLIQDNFNVKFTNNNRETVEYLATLTSILKTNYQEKTLVSCPKQNLTQSRIEDDLVSLMNFQEFNKGASKTRNFKARELFIRQLLQLKGMSVEKALAVIEKYPTPKNLHMAYKTEQGISGEKLLSTLQYGKLGKKIGTVISKTLYQLYSLNKF